MVREAEAAEYLFTSDGKEFTGTGRELLKQIYHNQRLPLKYRMYAATRAIDFEPPPIIEAAAQEDPVDELLDEIRRRRGAKIETKDDQLRQKIRDGVFTEAQALEVRAFYTDTSDILRMRRPLR